MPDDYCIAERMPWAAARCTTRVEDCTYSLLFGIFDLHMPLLYGEGEKAFIRLQEEILKVGDDASILAWSGPAAPAFGMLALSPGACEMPPMLEEDQDICYSEYGFNSEKLGINGHFYMCPHVFEYLLYCPRMAHQRRSELL